MKLNLIHTHDQNKAINYLGKLIDKGALINLEEIKTNLSTQFNKYLHVCISHVAQELGMTIEQVKQIYFKQTVNPDIYVKRFKNKQGVEYIYLLSITNPGVDNQAGLEKFKTWVAEKGMPPCPDPDDKHYIAEILKNEYALKKQGLI